MTFVAVYHPDLGPSSLTEVPEELLDHHGERGWLPVPADVDVRDTDAVAALFAPDKPTKRKETPA